MNKETFKNIMDDVNNYVIQNGKPYIILEDYYMREIMTLYAKQHNLVKSTLLLLDNNMNEEAYVLARSALNNYFLIGYLLNDPDGSRLKEYRVQPLLSARKNLLDMKAALKRPLVKKLESEGKHLSFTITDINKKIKEIEKNIKSKGYNPGRNLLKIKEIAKNSDEQGLELYITFYSEGSKYEHSDVSTLDIYKKTIDEQFDKESAFIMDTNATNKDLGKVVYSIIIQSYLDSLLKIISKIKYEEQHLLCNFKEEKLNNIFTQAYIFMQSEI